LKPNSIPNNHKMPFDVQKISGRDSMVVMQSKYVTLPSTRPASYKIISKKKWFFAIF